MTFENPPNSLQELQARNQSLELESQQLHQDNARLRELALTDSLTGISNLWALKDTVEELAQTGRSFALFYIDLKSFKMVNEVTGHDGGDAALKETAEFLSDSTRETDVPTRFYPGASQEEPDSQSIATRKGGDEFILVVPLDKTIGGISAKDRRTADGLIEDGLETLKQRLAAEYQALPSVVRYNEHVAVLGEGSQLGLHIDWALYDPAVDENFDLLKKLREADPKQPVLEEISSAPKSPPPVRLVSFLFRVATGGSPEVTSKMLLESSDEPFIWGSS